jgi:two-component system, NarL family, sensor histidine kinase UhpB
MPPDSDLRLQLPQRVMRRAAWVAALTVALATAVGLWRTEKDIDDELRAAMSLAASLARLAQASQLDDDAVVQAVRAQGTESALRHLSLSLRNEQGRLLLGRRTAEPAAVPVEWLARWHARWRPVAAPTPISWPLQRSDGLVWTLILTAAPEAESREAIRNLLWLLTVLAAGSVAMLAVMGWNVRQALLPLHRLLTRINHLRAGATLPDETMDTEKGLHHGARPVHELQVINSALQTLAESLQQEQAQRRLLSQRMLSLQEDERAQLARDLHDEWGQRITALRVDAAWLLRRVADLPECSTVVNGMSLQCQQMQQDIRSLLTRLQPLGPAPQHASTLTQTSLQRLRELLQGLVAEWQAPGRAALTRFELQLQWQPPNGPAQAWPGEVQLDRLQLPSTLVLALYRMSQEALTNVARHARATHAGLQLHIAGALHAGSALQLDWQCVDDGDGLPPGDGDSNPRGNGLAGLRERAWSLGADLQLAPAYAHGSKPGLRAAARFQTRIDSA